MSSSNSPCAACKVRRCKCTQECVFAPYFPPDQPQKFANVHNVFGASNVAKLLNELDARHREDAVNSLAYEAEFRLRDPVYGCVGMISLLQHRLKQMQSDLLNAKKELATYIGPQAMLPGMQPLAMMMAQQQQHPGNPSSSSMMPYNMQPMMSIPTGPSGQMMIREPHQQQQQQHQRHQQQLFEAQQQLAAAVAAREQQDMFTAFDPKEQHMDPRHHHPHHQQQQQQQQQELLRLHNGFDPTPVSASGFNQLNNASALSPSLALGTFDNAYHLQPEISEHPHSHYHHQQQLQAQPLLQPQQQPQQPTQSHLLQQQRADSEDDRIMGTSG